MNSLNPNLIHLPEPRAALLLSKYNIAYPAHALAENLEGLFIAAEKIGYPLVLKVVSDQVVHKSDLGGVILNINDDDALASSYQILLNNLEKHSIDTKNIQVMVCRQEKPGWEFVVGVTRDDLFGPTLLFGLGGIYVELFNDFALRVCPLNRKEVFTMIEETKASKILNGFRGEPSLDIDSIVDLMLNLSILVVEDSTIKEIDLNPVRVYRNGCIALDARVIVEKQV